MDSRPVVKSLVTARDAFSGYFSPLYSLSGQSLWNFFLYDPLSLTINMFIEEVISDYVDLLLEGDSSFL